MSAETAQAAVESANLWTEWIQLGFAGFCLILLMLGAWAVRSMVRVLWQMNTILTANTATLRELTDTLQTGNCPVAVRSGLSCHVWFVSGCSAWLRIILLPR